MDRADEATCMQAHAPVFNTNRMVRDYTEKFYIPAFTRGGELAADGMARAIALAKSKDSLRHRWGGIKIVGVHTSGNGHFKVGEAMQVEALVDLPNVDPKDLTVQLYAGPVNARGEIEQPQRRWMMLFQGVGAQPALVRGKVRLPHERPPGVRDSHPARNGGSCDAF